MAEREFVDMPNDFNRIRRFKIVDNRHESARIFTLTLEPEVGAYGNTPLQFKPGQFVFLHLLNEDGTTWKAPFSIANAPDAAGGRLELTIKIYKDFTARASKLAPGDVVGVQGPFGMFVPDAEASSHVFFASGIAITPFASIIRDACRPRPGSVIPVKTGIQSGVNSSGDPGIDSRVRGNDRKITLFYSVREIENFVFREEFERLAKEWPSFKPVFILTGEAPKDWKGERGRFDAAMLDRHAADLEGAHFMACGLPAFVETVKKVLENKGIDLKTRFKEEMFG